MSLATIICLFDIFLKIVCWFIESYSMFFKRRRKNNRWDLARSRNSYIYLFFVLSSYQLHWTAMVCYANRKERHTESQLFLWLTISMDSVCARLVESACELVSRSSSTRPFYLLHNFWILNATRKNLINCSHISLAFTRLHFFFAKYAPLNF